jgi:hypothetical protein
MLDLGTLPYGKKINLRFRNGSLGNLRVKGYNVPFFCRCFYSAGES